MVGIKQFNPINYLNLQQNKAAKQPSSQEIKAPQQFISSKGLAQPSAGLLKAYNVSSPISFGRRWEEHKSWGCDVKLQPNGKTPTGEISFKVWAPDVKEMAVEIRDPRFEANISKEEAKSMGLNPDDKWVMKWHMSAKTDPNERIPGTNKPKSKIVPMKQSQPGVFEVKVDQNIGKVGDMYRFVLTNKNGKTYTLKDPQAACQPHLFSWSKIYNQADYNWSQADKDWMSGKIPGKVSDAPTGNKIPVSALVQKQVHIPTITDEGTIQALIKEIPKIKEEGIFNAILLMPTEGCYGPQWGYGATDKFAISHGLTSVIDPKDGDKTNDALKKLVDVCHQNGINIGIDWVPSHSAKQDNIDEGKQIGPPNPGESMQDYTKRCYDNYMGRLNTMGYVLDKYGESYEAPGGWGGVAYNLEGKYRKDAYNYYQDNNPQSQAEIRSKVRDYVSNMALNYVKNYHVDFLRTDQTPAMDSLVAMKQVAAEVKHHCPDAVIFWEDHRKELGLTRPLSREEKSVGNVDQHVRVIEDISNNRTSADNLGGNEHWDFGFSHTLEALMRGRKTEGYPASVGKLAETMQNYTGTKIYFSHDEIGNREGGARGITKSVMEHSNIWERIQPAATGELSARKAFDVVNPMIQKYLYDKPGWAKMSNEELIASQKDVIKAWPLQKGEIEALTDQAVSLQKAAVGATFMAPGSKLLFQGDEFGETNQFGLMGQQAWPGRDGLSDVKGYDIQDIGSNRIDPKNHKVPGLHAFTKELSAVMKRNHALQVTPDPYHTNDMIMFVNEGDKVLGMKRWDNEGNLVLAVMNFSGKDYYDYGINSEKIPGGQWKELNSNNAKYGGNNNAQNGQLKTYDGYMKLNIPANGIVILEQNT